MPVKVCDTLLNPAVKVIAPKAGPGEPEGGEKVMENVLLPWAGIVKGTVGKPETENSRPEISMAITVTSAPGAVRMPTCGELLVPSGTVAKLTLAGEISRVADCTKAVS